MIELERLLSRCATRLSVCLVVLVLGVVAAGCGSEGQSPAGDTADNAGKTAHSAGTTVDIEAEAAQHGTGTGGNRTADEARGTIRRGERDEGPRNGSSVASEQAARHCPVNFEAATCEALIKAARKQPEAGAYEAVVTGDCTEVLTKPECEAVRAAQKQAAEAPDSILMSGAEFKECLKNPTPRCEELLGPLLERQREFEESQAGD